MPHIAIVLIIENPNIFLVLPRNRIQSPNKHVGLFISLSESQEIYRLDSRKSVFNDTNMGILVIYILMLILMVISMFGNGFIIFLFYK